MYFSSDPNSKVTPPVCTADVVPGGVYVLLYSTVVDNNNNDNDISMKLITYGWPQVHNYGFHA